MTYTRVFRSKLALHTEPTINRNSCDLSEARSLGPAAVAAWLLPSGSLALGCPCSLISSRGFGFDSHKMGHRSHELTELPPVATTEGTTAVVAAATASSVSVGSGLIIKLGANASAVASEASLHANVSPIIFPDSHTRNPSARYPISHSGIHRAPDRRSDVQFSVQCSVHMLTAKQPRRGGRVPNTLSLL